MERGEVTRKGCKRLKEELADGGFHDTRRIVVHRQKREFCDNVARKRMFLGVEECQGISTSNMV